MPYLWRSDVSKGKSSLEEAVKLLGAMGIDEFPHSRLAAKAASLIEEFKAWQRGEYPYGKTDPPKETPGQ